MTRYFLTPGPSHIHPVVPQAIKEALSEGICSISHRSKLFEQIYEETCQALRDIMQIPVSHSIFFLGSATEAMERLIENCVEKSSFHFVNGEFSKRFFGIAQELGRAPLKLEASPGDGFNLDDAKVPDSTDLICITQNETSTGAWLPEDGIAGLKKRYPEKLVAVDIVSSAPVSQLDFGLIDAAFFSVQKCFGLPAGLGVLIAGSRCLEKAGALLKAGKSTGSYHNFKSLQEYGAKKQTPETPNVLGIYLLGKVAAAYRAEGAEKLRTRVKENAGILYKLLEKHKTLKPFVKKEQFRSPTVLTVESGQQTKTIQARLERDGICVGSGYGPFRDSHIRIANFPGVPDEAWSLLFKALEIV